MLTGWRDFDDSVRVFNLLQRRIDHAFGDWPAPRAARYARSPWPAINAFETKEAFVYKAQVPGLGEGEVSVQVENDVLVLRGQRKVDVPDSLAPRLRERAPVSFARSVALPGRVDGAAVTATIKDGILTVTLPKAKESLPRQIPVEAV